MSLASYQLLHPALEVFSIRASSCIVKEQVSDRHAEHAMCTGDPLARFGWVGVHFVCSRDVFSCVLSGVLV